MIKSINSNRNKLHNKKQKVIGKLLFLLTKKASNYFWGITDILSNKFNKFAEIYEKSIGSQYKVEYETIGISQDKKVLHIGCGAYPMTEITLVKIFSVDVTGIDKNPKAIKLAEEFIRDQKFDNKNKIKIELGDGVSYPLDKFDVLIISSCSYPKVRILDHVFKCAKKNSLIIVRELNTAKDDILKCINSHKDIVLEGKIHHPSPFFFLTSWDTFFLTKR
jgi:precorrin-6B methylase 2